MISCYEETVVQTCSISKQKMRCDLCLLEQLSQCLLGCFYAYGRIESILIIGLVQNKNNLFSPQQYYLSSPKGIDILQYPFKTTKIYNFLKYKWFFLFENFIIKKSQNIKFQKNQNNLCISFCIIENQEYKNNSKYLFYQHFT